MVFSNFIQTQELGETLAITQIYSIYHLSDFFLNPGGNVDPSSSKLFLSEPEVTPQGCGICTLSVDEMCV